jgi:hypothetical protein
MAKEEIQFVPGLFVKAPNQGAPSFVKAAISIKVAELGMWLREKHKAGEEWVNIDVNESKAGKWYAKVSTFKPKQEAPVDPTRAHAGKSAGRFEDVEDDIPW